MNFALSKKYLKTKREHKLQDNLCSLDGLKSQKIIKLHDKISVSILSSSSKNGKIRI